MFKFLSKKTEQQIVAEIHNEFDTAEDRLLAEADKMLSELGIDTETQIIKKAEKLIALGFKNAQPVKWLENSSHVKTREQAELIRYYKQNYPFQKFLTVDELERICNKYNLVFAPVANYIKDVPEKNIKEIELASKLKNKDECVELFKLVGIKDLSLINMLGKKEPVFTQKEIIDICIEYMGHNITEWTNKAQSNTWLFVVAQKLGKAHPDFYSYSKVENTDKSGLYIAAPESHFNLNGLTKKNNYSFFNITVTEVKDPIVFRYVRGGIQVLSKWGLESSDEALLNEINN